MLSCIIFPLLALVCVDARIQLIDTHVHNADLELFGQNFYTFPRAFPDLNRSWSMADFAAETSSLASEEDADVTGIVLMELEKQNDSADTNLAEAAFYQGIANDCDVDPVLCGGTKVLGLVAGAPLDKGANATFRYLRTLVTACPSTCGIRLTLWKKDALFFSNQLFLEGLAVLASFNLPFELLVTKEQLSHAAALAAAVPSVTFNLNHLGYPEIQNSSAFAAWQADIRTLAMLPNVYCKLSGLPQTFASPGWASKDFQPYIAVILEAFGARRVNYAGNWFVLMEARWEGSYVAMVKAVTRALSALKVSQGDLEWIYKKTAMELYRLPTP